ncbi:uncharacterized protein LOC124898555 [Capsicum annuum]|uniref:uncharacterized protein LOC124898555 n=1 Tax=Capsicum annuum TaxID=4072 RepID=UPI001FB07FBB|nr:uncharacterized protein LOC124898555 [Capsicum annuum]
MSWDLDYVSNIWGVTEANYLDHQLTGFLAQGQGNHNQNYYNRYRDHSKERDSYWRKKDDYREKGDRYIPPDRRDATSRMEEMLTKLEWYHYKDPPLPSVEAPRHDKASINETHIMGSEKAIGGDDVVARKEVLEQMPGYVRSLCDLGSNINLIPLATFKQLGLNPPELTSMQLLMAGYTVKKLVGIFFDVIVRVDNFIFPADFVIMYCEIDTAMPIILGRPFMAIGRVMVDIEKGELKFRVNGAEATFNIQKSMKQLTKMMVVLLIDCF